ncbi:MAG TPA: DUF3515 domain-containing protein [Pseudonocardiaceae bacterium]
MKPTLLKPTLSVPLLIALGLSAVLVVGVAVAGIVLGRAATPPTATPPAGTGPVLLVPVSAPLAGSSACAALARTLPAALSNGGKSLRRRPLAAPAPVAAAAWGAGDPVVLRCGIERPPELTATSELLEVSGVRWFEVTGDGAATWYAVDRPAVVALTLPDGLNTGPIQDVSTAINAAMPAVPVF